MNGKLIVVDPQRCTGCKSCEVVCSTWNERETNPEKSRIRILSFKKDRFNYPVVCQQCTDPLCVEICPMNAIARDEKSGIMRVKRDDCIGCKLCLQACPFGAMCFVSDYAAKCNLCDGNPKCVEVCEWKAITYGEPQKIGMGKRISIADLVRQYFEERWIHWRT